MPGIPKNPVINAVMGFTAIEKSKNLPMKFIANNATPPMTPLNINIPKSFNGFRKSLYNA